MERNDHINLILSALAALAEAGLFVDGIESTISAISALDFLRTVYSLRAENNGIGANKRVAQDKQA